MNPKTIILVAVLHLIALALLLSGDCDSTPERPPHPGGANLNQEGATPPDEPSPGSGPTHGSDPERATPGRVHAGRGPFRRADFRQANVPMPAALEQRANACKTGIVLDWTARAVLWEKNADEAEPCASMTKMMTSLVMVETIAADPEWTLDSKIPVTREAAAVGGSQVYLDPRETFTADELLKCMMIFSANDAAHLVAETFGDGDPARFVTAMNRRAGELGLDTMHFSNPHGLPAADPVDENRGSCFDFACLGGLLCEYPRILHWSGTRLSWLREDTKPFQLVNRNGLVGRVDGVDGMKTGYTSRSKFCITVTCRRADRRIIVAVSGCPAKKQRNDLVRDLLEWSYSSPAQ